MSRELWIKAGSLLASTQRQVSNVLSVAKPIWRYSTPKWVKTTLSGICAAQNAAHTTRSITSFD